MCKKMICLTTLVLLVACLSATPAIAVPVIEDPMTAEDISPVAVYAASANSPTIDNSIDGELDTDVYSFALWDLAVEDPAWVIYDMGSPKIWDRMTWWNRSTSGNLFANNVDVYIFTNDDPCDTPILTDSNDLVCTPKSKDNVQVFRHDITFTSPLTVRYLMLWFDDGQQSAQPNIQVGEIAFGRIPVIEDPAPANNGTDYGRNQTLVWVSDIGLTKADVYFDSNETAVTDANKNDISGIYRGRQSIDDRTYTPTEIPLTAGTKYYWRVDGVNDLDIPETVIGGATWNFTAGDYLVIDDIETYGERNDDTDPPAQYLDRREIRKVWNDGYGGGGGPWTNGGNVTVSSAHRDPCTGHRDYLSMVIDYDNDSSILLKTPGFADFPYTVAGPNYFSEVEAPTTGANSLEIGSDWTAENSVALQLYFYGQKANDNTQNMYLVLADSNSDEGMVLYDGAATDLNDGDWHSWDIDLADSNFAEVDMADVQKIVIGFGVRGETTTPGGSGVTYIDDIRLHPVRCVIAKTGKPDKDYNNDCIVGYEDLKYMLNEWLYDNR